MATTTSQGGRYWTGGRQEETMTGGDYYTEGWQDKGVWQWWEWES